MKNDKFEVISVLGPLGAGKTTTLNHLIEEVPLEDSYAVVVNDVGENNIDAQRIWDHPANRTERIIPLTAGCIGCSDVTQFRDALEQVHDAGVNVLFIEPTGIAPGTEIADVVRSSGYNLSILTLVNAQTVERDLKWQVLPSQLAVADIVGITHIPKGRDELEVVDQVLDTLPLLPADVSVELIKPHSTDYFEILAKLRGVDRQLRVGRHVVEEICHIGCSHDHSHHHDHGVSAKSYKLNASVSVEDLEKLLLPRTESHNSPLLRAKGVVDGIRFDLVGNEWNTTLDSSELATMNVIFGGSIPHDFMEMAVALSEPTQRIAIRGDKKSIVKSISEMPIADRVAIVADRITQYPSPISAFHGELIPDCEADEGYEIAFWGNQDDMPRESKLLAMDAYIDFRLKGLHELVHHADTIKNADEKANYWLRRYGATLGYNGYHLTEYIQSDALAEIRNHNPAQMLIDGLMQLDSLTFDEGRAEEKPEFLLSVLKPALSARHIDVEDVKKLEQHISVLSSTNPEYLARWQKTFDTLTNENYCN